jgi:tetrapyrrole methylase family protein/MazG family protein
MDVYAGRRYGVSDLIEIMRLLRADGGCPWDREQTHASIRKNLIEEAYEVAEAIDRNDAAMLCEELGDLLLQVVFHSQISREAGNFTLDDVADGICKKLIVRHPHIFAEAKVADSDEVLDNWDEIKKREKGQTTATETLRAVPRVFPALMRSQKVQKRAAKTGFDYPDVDMALSDLEKEIDELREAMQKQDKAACAQELGDLIFSAVNVARKLRLDAEECLTQSCDKFVDRFARVEELATQRRIELRGSPLDRLNELWSEAKHLEDPK